MTCFEMVMSFLTAIYVVTTIFYAVTSHRTLVAIRKQGADNASQFTQQISEAQKSANAAFVSSQSVMNAERARIVVSFTTTSGRAGHFMTIRNCGRTPAFIVDVKFIRKHPPTMQQPHLPDVPDFGLPTEFMQKRILCAGGRWKPQDYYVSVSPTELTDKLHRLIESGHTRYYIYGRVEYRDVFRNDELHETRFCYFFSPTLQEFIVGGPPEYTKYS
jgi:hypothetical protein